MSQVRISLTNIFNKTNKLSFVDKKNYLSFAQKYLVYLFFSFIIL